MLLDNWAVTQTTNANRLASDSPLAVRPGPRRLGLCQAFLTCLPFCRGGEGFETRDRSRKSATELGSAPQPHPVARNQAEENIRSQNIFPRRTSQRRNDGGELIHSLR